MKTNAGLPFVVLIFAGIAGIFWSVWSSMQVNLAVTQIEATTAEAKLSETAVIAGQVSGWALKTALGVVAVAIATGVVAFAREKIKQSRQKKHWQPGPNAYWGQQQAPKQPKPMSQAEIFQLWMQQQMFQNMPKQERPQMPELPKGDDSGNVFW